MMLIAPSPDFRSTQAIKPLIVILSEGIMTRIEDPDKFLKWMLLKPLKIWRDLKRSPCLLISLVIPRPLHKFPSLIKIDILTFFRISLRRSRSTSLASSQKSEGIKRVSSNGLIITKVKSSPL